MIDLRSDTVTQPTDAMRRAMATAVVGDDVYGEDPTVNRLQEVAAALIGKEAALFVPTGTMGNQIAIAVHTRPGSEVLCESRAHIVEYEMASMAVIAGCLPRPVPTPDGVMTAALIERTLRPTAPLMTRPGVIVVENTHNLASGAVTPPEALRDIVTLAGSQRIPLHMDGARIFHAALATATQADELARGFDSIMFCLSKGLCAPVGSMLAGSREFIDEARRWRKRLGGGMRQAGVLAAAGLVALETMRDRLAEDHENARALASALGAIEDIRLDTPRILTNIVYVKISGARWRNRRIVAGLKERGILCNAVSDDRIRFVTHHGIDRAAIITAIDAIGPVVSQTRGDAGQA